MPNKEEDAATLTSDAPLKHQKSHIYLIDGSGFIFRAFHAIPSLSRPDGTPINAVYGFTTMLLKILEKTDVDYFTVVFDVARRNFRHDIYADYKANRPPPPPELVPQFPLIREVCTAFNVAILEQEGFEADDLIATYARAAQRQGMDVTIVSSDKDLMQLVSPGIDMLDPLKDKKIGPNEVWEKFGVEPNRVVDVQALAGDSSDHVPGVPGIGIKTAAELITTYGTLEALLSRLDEIKQPKRRQALLENKENALISKQLVLLKDDIPLIAPLEALRRQTVEMRQVIEFLEAQNFKTMIGRVQRLIASDCLNSTTTSGMDVFQLPPSVVTDYTCIQDFATLNEWIQEAKSTGVVAIDTETNNLNPHQADLVGISLASSPGKAAYIPLSHRTLVQGGAAMGTTGDLFDDTSQNDIIVPGQLPRAEVLKALAPLLNDPSVLKVGHNLKYDMCVLANYGVPIEPYDDTIVFSYVLDGARAGHSMDELARRHLGHETISYGDVTGKGRSQVTFDYVDLERATFYAAEDADITLRLYDLLKQRLFQEHLVGVYERFDRPLIQVLAEMEGAGILIDVEYLKTLSARFDAKIRETEEEIFNVVGSRFNVGSPKQLGEILFEVMKLPDAKKSKTGAYVTDVDVLETLSGQGHSIADKILTWRGLSKLKSTYTDALQKQINPRTKRIHTSYSMTTTSTGRLSSHGPNLQNIPIKTQEGREIRRAFIAKPGTVIVSLDYSQIELRLIAHMARVDSLCKAFHDGLDIHAITASEVFGVPFEAVDSSLRRKAKAINFGIIYGISAFGLARQLHIDRTEAANYIKAYHAKYPGIIQFMEDSKQFARAHGYVETLFGRHCIIQGIADKNAALRSFAERQAINAPVQGTAADIIKRAMIDIQKLFKERSYQSKMLLQVHDELVFEVVEAERASVIDAVKLIMETVCTLSVPLLVDVGVGPNWNDAH
jgi:DNA polymerase-1